MPGGVAWQPLAIMQGMVQIFGEAFRTIFLEVELHQSHLRRLTYPVFLNQRDLLVAHHGLNYLSRGLSSLILVFLFAGLA